MRTYVILDPQHEYGVALVAAMRRQHGLDPIVVFSSAKEAHYRRGTYPELEAHRVATYTLDDLSPAEMAADIRRQGHEVLAVVPYFEQGIKPLAELMPHLGVTWNDPAVLARFRDKEALKAAVQRADPRLPLGLARRVASADDVFAGDLPARFVIKPNDGFANRDIGFFSRATSRQEIEAYFRQNTGAAVLEEFFVGDEYAVNGQMDHEGRALVVNVTRYERTAGNGKPNLYHRTHHVPRHDPAFAPLAAYAQAVMRATGLLRCPFHMELIATAAGPRLVEVAARFGGTRYAFMANDVHGGSFDIFALAAHYYLSAQDFGPPAFDWEHYDRVHYIHVDGISHADGTIFSMEGAAEVESLPEFRGWVVEPRVGGRLYRTLDLYQVPYSLHLMSHHSDQAVRRAAARAESLLVFNRRASLPTRLWVTGRRRLANAHLRASWLALRLRARARRAGLTAK